MTEQEQVFDREIATLTGFARIECEHEEMKARVVALLGGGRLESVDEQALRALLDETLALGIRHGRGEHVRVGSVQGIPVMSIDRNSGEWLSDILESLRVMLPLREAALVLSTNQMAGRGDELGRTAEEERNYRTIVDNE